LIQTNQVQSLLPSTREETSSLLLTEEEKSPIKEDIKIERMKTDIEDHKPLTKELFPEEKKCTQDQEETLIKGNEEEILDITNEDSAYRYDDNTPIIDLIDEI